MIVERKHLTNQTHPNEIAAWCGGYVSFPGQPVTGGPLMVRFQTPDGVADAYKGDTIARTDTGEFYLERAAEN